MADWIRSTAGLLLTPAAMAAGAWHRWATARALLELDLEPVPDLASRTLLLQRLHRAAQDPRVVGLLLRFKGLPGGFAASHDLRNAIRQLRRAGKVVWAWLETPGTGALWVASACDRLFLAPTGELLFVGLGTELTFFGAALSRLGVAPDFEAAGEYKSFGEPFTRSFASPANHEATLHLLSDLQDQLLLDISSDRGIDRQGLLEVLDRAPLSPAQAKEARLVDDLAYPDELDAEIERQFGKDIHRHDFSSWSFREGLVDNLRKVGQLGKTIAVLHMEGAIVLDGPSGSPTLKASAWAPLLRGLQENDQVAAVVLHVNSPGGSAFASDLIWREVDRLAAKKPVVAVYEDVSASGGVYLAAPAKEIIVRPTTLTGSIGVFGGKLVVGEGLRKIGVMAQEISVAPNATVFSGTRPFSDPQRERFRASLQRFYDGFVDRVASGRGLPADIIEPHCRGRVWSGRAAVDRKLVDRTGDLTQAIDRARSLAGLAHKPFRRRDFSGRTARGLLQRAVTDMFRQQATVAFPLGSALSQRFGELPADVQVLMAHDGEPLAMMPWAIPTLG